MRKIVLILMAVMLSCQLSAREVININRNWKFFNSQEGGSDAASTVNLPHTWNRDALAGKDDYQRGAGNYVKDIKIPLKWRNKRVFIRFNGAATVADLMINGRYVGKHKGGYTAFTFEITSFLNYGETNKFWVVVNNAPRMDVLPTAGDMNIYGGLYRDVELIVAEPSMLSLTDSSGEGVYLSPRSVLPNKADIDAIVKIDGLRDRTLDIKIAVETRSRDTVFLADDRYRIPISGKGQITIPLEVENPRMWNGLEDPYMYNVIVKVWDDNIFCDSVCIPLGIRSFTADPQQGFMLNGALYPLRGVIYYEDRAGVGTALTPADIDEDIDMMMEMGVNVIRAAGYPHNDYFYKECDRRGIVVCSDLPLIGGAYFSDIDYVNEEGFLENGRQQLTEMIYQHYNNPSVLIWCLFSNLKGKGGDDPAPFIEELNSIAMREDPSRMSMASSSDNGKMNFITDLISWDHIFGWKEGTPADITIWLQQLVTNWGSLCSAVSYGAGASVYHQDDTMVRPDHMGFWHPERWQTYLHEQYYMRLKDANFLWGKFIANMFDYGAAGRNWGDGSGVDDRGMVTFDRKYRKDAFYFYKANWNKTDPFVHIAEKRWDRRAAAKQSLKVFSNAEQVELFLNGKSLGAKTGTDGTFLWPDVDMSAGMNAVEARSGKLTDRARIEIDPKLTMYNIR